jgi:hypothetical protein
LALVFPVFRMAVPRLRHGPFVRLGNGKSSPPRKVVPLVLLRHKVWLGSDHIGLHPRPDFWEVMPWRDWSNLHATASYAWLASSLVVLKVLNPHTLSDEGDFVRECPLAATVSDVSRRSQVGVAAWRHLDGGGKWPSGGWLRWGEGIW